VSGAGNRKPANQNVAGLRRPPPAIPRGTVLFIVLGVAAYLGLRQLPPDSSLAQVQAAGVLNVCVPPGLTPYVMGDAQTQLTGSEAQLVQKVARRLGVPVAWSLQPDWGSSPDPVDWGLRPESCDLLAGGIVAGDETRALMTPVPYAQARWALLRLPGNTGQLAILNGHWGLGSDVAFDWADKRQLAYDVPATAQETLDGLQSGKYRAVLALQPEAEWLRGQLGKGILAVQNDLPTQTLMLGVWKTRITLRRAVAAGIAQATASR
jgi:polar amino acid transport system substrate-binding protein